MGALDKEYPSNSLKDREVKQEQEDRDIRINKPVIKGHVAKRKKTVGSKLLDLFVPEDVDDIKNYILTDVFIPAAKNMLQDAFDIFLNGGTGSRRYRGGGTKVSYSSFYERGLRRDRDRDDDGYSRMYAFDDVVLETRGEAEEVLDYLYDMLKEYSIVRVADLYDTVGITDRSHTSVRFGWTDLRGSKIVRAMGGGFILKLPNPRPIN